jgi:hypothetical protein
MWGSPSLTCSPYSKGAARQERRDELLARPEGLDPRRGPVGVGLAIACLPGRRPEPGLRGVDQLLWAQQDALVRRGRGGGTRTPGLLLPKQGQRFCSERYYACEVAI